MKYYLGEIETYFGESEVNTTIKFQTEGNPDDYLDGLAAIFWGSEAYLDDDSSLYDFGDKSTCGGRWQEVNQEIYEAITLLPELRLNKGETA